MTSWMLTAALWTSVPASAPPRFKDLPPEDQRYLRTLARETWDCLASLEAPRTGLPFDNSDRAAFTSVSNIGVYLASACAARALGFEGKRESDQRLERCFSSLERLKTKFGFQQSWNSVIDLSPGTNDPWISLLDSGNLAAGLVTVEEMVPKFRSRAEKLLAAMQWDRFYDSKQAALLGGYSMEKNSFNEKWHLDLLASDALLCQFFSVSSRATPESFWKKLKGEQESRDGYTYLAPGWQGGGLFMQYLAGIWLDLSQTPVAASARNFTLAQIAHAKAVGAPVWGWSACDNPAGGYLGWGSLRDEVATPHASALAMEAFPVEAIANLRTFEKLGARSKKFGFFDSLDWRTEARSKLFLCFDQGMLLLSLTNYMEDGLIRRRFHENPMVRRGQLMMDRAFAHTSR